MKKRTLGILLIIALALVYFFLLRPNTNGAKTKIDAFTIDDPTLVTAITIIDHSDTLELTKTKGTWLVNKKHLANTNKLNPLLNMSQQLSIISPVGEANKQEIEKALNNSGVRLMFKKDKKTLLNYQLTHTHLNAARKDKSKRMYFVEVPGLNKNLLSHCSTSPNYWKWNRPFAQVNGISGIEVVNTKNPKKSYSINLKSKPPTVFKLDGIHPIDNTKLLQAYLKEMAQMDYREPNPQLTIQEKENILQENPFLILNIEANTNQKYACYKKPLVGKTDAFGLPVKWDPNVFYLMVPETGLVECKYSKIEHILIGL